MLSDSVAGDKATTSKSENFGMGPRRVYSLLIDMVVRDRLHISRVSTTLGIVAHTRIAFNGFDFTKNQRYVQLFISLATFLIRQRVNVVLF